MQLFLQMPEVLYVSAQKTALFITARKGMLYKVTVRKRDGIIENGMAHNGNTMFLVVNYSLE